MSIARFVRSGYKQLDHEGAFHTNELEARIRVGLELPRGISTGRGLSGGISGLEISTGRGISGLGILNE